MKRTKSSVRIGPTCESSEIISKLIETGLDIARLNFSHSSHIEHGKCIATLSQTAAKQKKLRNHARHNGL